MDRWLRGGSVACLVAVLLLQGCVLTDDTESTGGTTTDTSGRVVAVYNPAAGELPFPDNLLFLGSDDGTINRDVPDSDPSAVLNDLHGFSSIEPWVARFTGELDPASVADGVYVFRIDTEADTPYVPVSPEAGGRLVRQTIGTADPAQFAALVDGSRLVIQPRAPLPEGADYLVVVTSGLRDTHGNGVVAGVGYRTLRQPFSGDAPSSREEQLSQLIDSHIALAQAGTGGAIDRDAVVLSWTVTTQDDIAHTLDKLRTTLAGNSVRVIRVPGAVTSPAGSGSIHVGSLDVRYGLGVPADLDPDNPLSTDLLALTRYWQCGDGEVISCQSVSARDASDEGLYRETLWNDASLRVPVLLTRPESTAPIDGYPVVIFQHGLTRNRGDLLSVADQLADLGFIGVAIDAPLHGIGADDDIAGLRPSLFADEVPEFATVLERTFRLPAADGSGLAASGAYYLNLDNPLVLRDNLRQTSADLFALIRALQDGQVLDLGDASAIPVDPDRIHFLGHSLGGTASIPFIARESGLLASAVGMPASGLSRQIATSPGFREAVLAALAERGIMEGTAAFQQFLIVVQSVLNDVEPLNYAGEIAAGGRPFLLTQIIGGPDSPGDQVLPPLPDPVRAPLSGSAVFAGTARLTTVLDPVPPGTPLQGVISFNAGAHGDYVAPPTGDDAPADAVRAAMRTQYLGFLASDGTALPIGDASLVADPAD